MSKKRKQARHKAERLRARQNVRLWRVRQHGQQRTVCSCCGGALDEAESVRPLGEAPGESCDVCGVGNRPARGLGRLFNRPRVVIVAAGERL